MYQISVGGHTGQTTITVEFVDFFQSPDRKLRFVGAASTRSRPVERRGDGTETLYIGRIVRTCYKGFSRISGSFRGIT
jgi:hypothetical protein